jgi:hypothetical protein
MNRALFLAAAFATTSAAALAACGSSSNGPASSPTPTVQPSPTATATPRATPVPSAPATAKAAAAAVTDATATRDRLLALAPQGTAINPASQPEIEAWKQSYPALGFSGAAVPATAASVSGFAFVTSKAKQQDYLAFAVMDTAGRCAGGILTGTDTKPYTVTSGKAFAVAAGTKCTGSAVADAAGY